MLKAETETPIPPSELLTAAPCPPPAAPSCSSARPWGSGLGRAARRGGCSDPRPWSGGGAGLGSARLGSARPGLPAAPRPGPRPGAANGRPGAGGSGAAEAAERGRRSGTAPWGQPLRQRGPRVPGAAATARSRLSRRHAASKGATRPAGTFLEGGRARCWPARRLEPNGDRNTGDVA